MREMPQQPRHRQYPALHAAQGGSDGALRVAERADSRARALRPSLLGWSAWQRMLLVLPLLIFLWLALAWSSAGAAPC